MKFVFRQTATNDQISTFQHQLIFRASCAGSSAGARLWKAATVGYRFRLPILVLVGLVLSLGSTRVQAAAPVVSSSGTATGQVGVAFSYQISATNTPTSFSAAGLASGLSVNTSTGLISGTPTAAAVSSVTLGATNASGTGNKTLTLTVKPPTPVITSALTAIGQKGVSFNYQITASNSPTSYAATGLPTGLTVSSTTGAITGTPSTAATTNVTIKAINAGGTGTATLVLTVNPATPVISSAATASGTTGHAFSYQIAASNTPTSFSATNLPSGLSVNTSTGLISGTPSTIASTSVSLGATNAGGTGSKSLTINITLGTPVVTSPYIWTAVTGVPFSYQITGSNSPTSYNALSLPSGLSVNTATGLISGTVTTASSTNVQLKATNSAGYGVLTLLLIFHQPTSVMTSAGTAVGKVGAAFSYQLTGSLSPYAFDAAGLPPGLDIDTSTGIISGTPTVPGNYSVYIEMTNAGGTSSSTVIITILPSLPYAVDFESTEGYAATSLNGQLGWSVLQGVATISSSDHANGAQSVQLASGAPAAQVTQSFARESGQTIEYFDFFAKPVAVSAPASSTTFSVESSKFAFLISGGNGILQALNGNGTGGGTWSSTLFSLPLGAGNQVQTWIRLTARLDFTTQKWDLYANAQMVAADIPFVSNSTYLSTFQMQGDTSMSSGLDYIYAGPTNPLFSDTNNNGIDDTWETSHGFSLANNNRNTSPTGNGVTAVQAYVGGSDPNDFFNGTTPTVTILGGNNQTTLVGQFNQLAFDVGVWNSAGTAPLINAPVSFTVQSGGGKLALTNTGSPALSNTINLYTDINGTAQVYYLQPTAPSVTSTISFAAGVGQATFTTATASSDSDGNGLLDSWELHYFGAVGVDPNADPDGDGKTNAQEFAAGSNPLDYYNGRAFELDLSASTTSTVVYDYTFGNRLSGAHYGSLGYTTYSPDSASNAAQAQTYSMSTGGPITLWRTANNLPADGSGNGGDGTVVSFDGLPNLAKYAFGLDPNALIPTDQPSISLTTISGVSYLTLTYNRPATAPADLTYTVQTSADGVSWAASSVDVGTTINGSVAIVVVRDLTASGSSNLGRRIRLLIKRTAQP